MTSIKDGEQRPPQWEMRCLKCGSTYGYYSYPPYPDCFNCGSLVVEIKRLG